MAGNTDFAWERREDGDAAVFVLTGELDMASAPEAAAMMVEAIRETNVVIDASRLTFMDSHGIAAVIDTYRAANAGLDGDREIVVRNPSPQVRRVLEITGMSRLIEDRNG
jgi:stage II sporulation protein AA (anti-sigma F factor antagonist)